MASFMRSWLRSGLVVAALAMPEAPRAAGDDVAPPVDHPGRYFYVKYCGTCHGPEGRGDGVAAVSFRVQPPNLTRIAHANGGKFPFARVMESIDGRNTPRAHGSPDMPVWGESFRSQAATPEAQRADIRARLVVITDYIRSIQTQ
jgi:hypothetical protein